MNDRETAHSKLSEICIGLTTEATNIFLDCFVEERAVSDDIKGIFKHLCEVRFPEIKANTEIYDRDDVLQVLETYYEYQKKGYKKEKKDSEEEISIKELRMKVITYLTGKYIFKTFSDTEEIFFYNPEEGIFVKGANIIIRKETKILMGDEYSKYQSNEVIANIQALTYIEREEFNNGEEWIVVKNGLLNIFTREFKDFRPDFLSITKIPTKYDKDAKCPAIEKFISEVVGEGDVRLIEEMIGYCLYPGYPFQNWFLLHGAGENGKSTLLSLIDNFLGRENISSIGLQNLNQRFALPNLIGKLANIVADLSSSDLRQTSNLKACSGGDMMSGEKKGIQDYITFFNTAKLIYSCNNVPLTEDKSRAFFRRYIPIGFNNLFVVGENADEKLLDKLTTEEELSGLLNLSLTALKRLFDNHTFTNNLTVEEKEDLYERASNPVYSFFHDRCEIDYEGYTVKNELYNAFCAYCKEIKTVVFSERRFVQQLRLLVNLEEEQKTVIGRKARRRVWLGIVLKDCTPYTPCTPLNPLLRKKEKEESNLFNKESKGEQGVQGVQGVHPVHTPSEVLNGGICNVCGEYDNCLIINYQDGIARCRECIKIDNPK